jgi:hypothetical protein
MVPPVSLKPDNTMMAVTGIDSRTQKEELVYIASLQGLVAKKDAKIFIEYRENSFWYEPYEKLGYKFVSCNIDEMTKIFLSRAKGYVLCDMESITVAATLAGPMNAVVVPEVLLTKYTYFDKMKQLYDVRGKDEEWLLEYVKANLSKFNLDAIVQNNPDVPFTMIDYAIANNHICAVGRDKPDLVRAFYSLIKPNNPRIGWGTPYKHELQDVGLAAEYGLYTLPGANTVNMSFFSKAKADAPKLKFEDIPLPDVKGKGVHYVMIMMSDGDNMNYTLSGMVQSQKYILNPNCAGIPMNWMYSPSMQSMCPGPHTWYATSLPRYNYLIGGVSGMGYTFPSEQKHLDEFCIKTNAAMKASGLDYCVIMDRKDFRTEQKDILKGMLAKMPDVKGLYYMDYSGYDKWKGDYYKIDGRPVISFRHRLWLPKFPLEDIAAKINASSRNPEELDAYSAVVVHAWSYTMDDVARFIELLNDDVVLVNGSQFMELINKNVKADNL